MVTIAYNVFSFDGYLHPPGQEKGRPAGCSPGLQARAIGRALRPYQPDILTTSESRDERSVAELADELGCNYAYFPSPGQWPGALLTRYPIQDYENCPISGDRPEDLFTRHWGRAVLDATDGPLIVHSIHTFASDPAIRWLELDALLPRVTEDLKDGADVIVQGDLNHRPDDPEYPRWATTGMIDSYAYLSGESTAGETLLRPHPCRRLDYIFLSSGFADSLTEARPLFENEFRLYADRPEAASLSDHLPQMARFNSVRVNGKPPS